MKHVSRVGIFLWILFLAIALSACGRSNFGGSVPAASGQLAAVTTSFPGVVMVVQPNSSGMCTGILVSNRAVLTASHCLQTSGLYTVRTSAGLFSTNQRFFNGPGTVDDTLDVGLLVFTQQITSDESEILALGNQVAEGDAVTLVGFGCNSIETRSGTGVKRQGSNIVSEKADYLVLLTPMSTSQIGIIGDSSQSGTCFGDSGGPLFKKVGSQYRVVGVTHAGGTNSNYYFSEFANVADNQSNRDFLRQINSNQSLGIAGL